MAIFKFSNGDLSNTSPHHGLLISGDHIHLSRESEVIENSLSSLVEKKNNYGKYDLFYSFLLVVYSL